MRSDELRAIFGAMSPRAVVVDDDDGSDGEIWHVNGEPFGGADMEPVRENAMGMVVLINHADAFAELTRACERIAATPDDCRASMGDVELVREALAAVHAIGREP